MTSNLRFVISIAKEYQGQGVSLIDLINEGNYGLVKAVSRYDHTKGFRFISYAVWWIKQSIIQSLNDTSRTITVAVGGSNYLCFAHRTGDTNVAQVQCGSGNNILTVAKDRSDATTITPLKETVSYLNTAGHTEYFYVYASKQANVDSHSTTFKTLTSTVKKNYFYWGYDAQADTYNESFIETSGDWDSHNENSSYDDGAVTGQT